VIKYKATLEVEIHVPDAYPEEQIPTAEQLREALLCTAPSNRGNGYAVCAKADTSKVTAGLHVTKVTFDSKPCVACGHLEPIVEKIK